MDALIKLRRALHAHPELSEKEERTREILKDFLRSRLKHTRIVDHGRWFYAIKEEPGAQETIAFRADHDAILGAEGPFHGCGHDGHSTILAGVALALDQVFTGKNIVYLFQHAEENGVGAKECVSLFDEVNVDRIYGLHNWPGFPKNAVVVKDQTLMCASRGLTIAMVGKQSHASEPEHGKNPIYALSQLASRLEPLSHFHGYKPLTWEGEKFLSMTLATIIYLKVGEQGAYGVSPSQGELAVTLRGARVEDLDRLEEKVRKMAKDLAEEEGLSVEFSISDAFPDTTNPKEEVDRLRKMFAEAGEEVVEMKEPIRSSEDFGWYQKKIPGVLFFLGSGTDCPDLHTKTYEFPDELLEKGIELFKEIALA